MSNSPPKPQVSLSNDSNATFLIRWRGRQEGPYKAAVIEAKLAANQIGLLHEVSNNGQWVALRDFFAEREAALRAESRAREERERQSREEAEQKAREREEKRRAEPFVRDHQSEVATTPMQTSTAPNQSLASLKKLLLKIFLVVSLLAFFLPNVTISLPVFGGLGVSMLDFLTPRPEHATSAPSNKPPAKPPKPTVQDLGDFRLERATVGGTVCMLAILALVGHYLLTVAWGTLEFGLRRTNSALTTTWLILAAQFPVAFSIGVQLMLSGVRREVSTGAGADDSNGLAALLFVNNSTIAPSLIMWILMGIALAVSGIQFYQKPLNQKTSTTNYGSIPHQP